MKIKMPAGTKTTAAIVLVLALLVIGAATPEFRRMHEEELIRKGAGVTAVKQLSDYFAKLKGTAGDTTVYVLDSGKPGGTVLLLGGTHPNEPSGLLSAVLLIENARPTKGKNDHHSRSNKQWLQPYRLYRRSAPQRFHLKRPQVNGGFGLLACHQPYRSVGGPGYLRSCGIPVKSCPVLKRAI